jgi:hypothetical protein
MSYSDFLSTNAESSVLTREILQKAITKVYEGEQRVMEDRQRYTGAALEWMRSLPPHVQKHHLVITAVNAAGVVVMHPQDHRDLMAEFERIEKLTPEQVEAENREWRSRWVED